MKLSDITTGTRFRPARFVVYGVDGIGKSTLAAGAPSPIFIGTESGTAHLNVARFPTCTTWDAIFDCIATLGQEMHEYQTVILDSATWAEGLCIKETCDEYSRRKGKEILALEDIPYGKGVTYVREKWPSLFAALDWLNDQGMRIIVIGHADVSRFNDPERETYDRYQLALDRENAKRLQQWADCVLFVNYDTVLRSVGEGFRERKVGADIDRRIVFTERRPAFDAKNRYRLPFRITLPNSPEPAENWQALAAHLPQGV